MEGKINFSFRFNILCQRYSVQTTNGKDILYRTVESKQTKRKYEGTLPVAIKEDFFDILYSIHSLNGHGGQSLGFALARGVFLELEGDSNDYVGKGLSGGKIVVYPHKDALSNGFVSQDNVIVGNLIVRADPTFGGGELNLTGMVLIEFSVSIIFQPETIN